MKEPKYLLFSGGDTPPEQKPPPASTEDRSRERVHGSDTMVMEGDSDITDQNNEGVFKTLYQIEEKASSILKLSLQFDYMIDSLEKEEERLRVVEAREKEISLLGESISDKLRVLEEKEMDFDLRKVIEATLMSLVFEKQIEEVVTHLEKHENKLGLLYHSMTKKLEHIMSESEAKKEEALRISESIHEKLCELEKAEKDLVLIQRAETEKWNEDRESMEESRKQLEAMEKELKRKEETFELKQKEEAEKWRQETERWNEERKQLREKKLSSLEEAIKEKSAELKRKEETFVVKQKEETEKWREETELKSKDLEIKEKTLGEMMKELEMKQMKIEERSKQQLVNAENRKRSNLEFEPLVPLQVEDDSDACSLTRLAKKHKSQETDLAFGNTDPESKHISEAKNGDTEPIVCTDKSDEDPKSLTCPDAKFNNDINKSMSSFAVDQVWALYDSTDDMPRVYAQIRRIFSWESDLSLQVTLLEHVETRKYEKSIPIACGRFGYGDTEIKSHLMFAHEMKHIKCGKHVIVNPRKGETWALFRDWNISWNSHSDLHEPPYRYDFVEVITEFDDHLGIAVAYMGRVEGFGKTTISPGEMQSFSHKVASRGEEKEGVPAGSFELNPAVARPSYDPLLQSKDCGKAPTVENQEGSTKDEPIIIG